MTNHRNQTANAVFGELSSSQKQLPLFRWLLVPLAFFLTLTPSALLALAKNPIKNASISEIAPVKENPEISAGIVLTPSLSFSGEDVLLACIWIIATLGISGLGHRNKVFGRFISIFLVAFTLLQTFPAFFGVFSINRAVVQSLNGAWQKAYDNNSDLIKDIQYEFSCKGFASITDRPVEIPESFGVPCGVMMIKRFSPQFYHVVLMVLASRLCQLIGVLALTHVFQKLLPIEDLEYTLEESSDFEYFTGVAAKLMSTAYQYITAHDVRVGDDDDEDEKLPQIFFLCDLDNNNDDDDDDGDA